jgi:hypothetical protein
LIRNAAINQYTTRALYYVSKIEEIVAKDAAAGQATDVSEIIRWFSFDFMGDFVFGTSFHLIDNQEWHWIVLRLQNAMNLLGPFSPVPWLIQLSLHLMPFFPMTRNFLEMSSWCKQQMDRRQKVTDV